MKQILHAAICIIIGILIGFVMHDILRWIYSTKHTESIAGERFGIILEDESIPLSQADADAIISICKSYENNTQPFTGIKMRQVVDRHVFVVHAWRLMSMDMILFWKEKTISGQCSRSSHIYTEPNNAVVWYASPRRVCAPHR